jgi:CBS domain-containing protein
MRTIRVRSAMKPVPVGIPTSATLEEAEERMDHDGVNWLPVVERGRLVGLITRLDLRQAVTGPR